MIDVSLFLEPVEIENIRFKTSAGQNQLANSLIIYSEQHKFPAVDGVSVAIIGVAEERNALDNTGCMHAPAYVRQALYPLFDHWPNLLIADLGDIRAGNSIDDTYFALSQVVEALISQNIIPLVIGGSNDLVYSLYQAYENQGRLVNILAIDPLFDIGQDENEFHSKAYLSRIIMQQPNYLFNFTNIGYQNYYVDAKAVELMKNLLFDVWRLGFIRSNMEEAEPVIRSADMVSFDIGAVRGCDAPANGLVNPNGFTGEEACCLARYAGMNEKLSCFGLFEINPAYDTHELTAKLAAQMIWYFLDGVANRIPDTPKHHDTRFAQYIVRVEGQEEELIFLKSKKTGRWWMDMSMGQQHQEKYKRQYFVPCSKKDYESALNDELPDRWWQFYQKLM